MSLEFGTCLATNPVAKHCVWFEDQTHLLAENVISKSLSRLVTPMITNISRDRENNGISNVEIKSLPLRTIVFYKSKSLPQSGKFVPNLRMFE